MPKSLLSFYPLLLGVFCMQLIACQDSIQNIELSVGSTPVLVYQKDFQPKLRQSFSENSPSYIDSYSNTLFISSISDYYKEGEYYSAMHIRRVDSLGNTHWLYDIDQFKQVSYKDFHATSDGVYILYEGYTGQIARDCYLLKLSLDGTRLWEVNFGKQYGTQIQDMMKLNARGNLVLSTKHYETAFLHEVSTAGEVLRTKAFTDKSELTIMDFDFDEAGNTYVIGQITSYPQKKHHTALFYYQLDANMQLLEQKLETFAHSSIANSIQYIGNGLFAIHCSVDIDHNATTIDKLYSRYALMDTDLNITAISQYRTDNMSSHQRFKLVGADQIICYDKIYLEGNSYFVLLEFDGRMNYRQSTLLNFNTGLNDLTILPSGELAFVRYSEELLVFDTLWRN